MITFYVASRYTRRDEMRLVADKLRERGHGVTSRWLYEDKPLNTHMGEDTDEFYATTARHDLEDIDLASHFLFFAEDPKIGTPRGGRHVEFGYALARGKQIRVIGPYENIFHYHNHLSDNPLLSHYATLDLYLGTKYAANR